MKKMCGRWRFFCLLCGVVALGGCASNSAYSPSAPVPMLTSCNGEKYNEEGHYNTTDLIARMAGFQKDEAKRLANFSQAPDGLWLQYSAPSVGVWGLPLRPFWSYPSNVMNVLHSLHNGNHAEVLERRSRLQREILSFSKPYKGADLWKVGFLIHAMGDSYAHSYGEMNNLHGYSEYFGHAFDNGSSGNRPDMIVMNNNYLIYIQYVQALFEALSQGDGSVGRTKLSDFTERIKREVEVNHVSNDKLIDIIRGYTYCGSEKSLLEWPASRTKVVDGVKENLNADKDDPSEWGTMEFADVSQFLSEVRERL